MPRKSIPTKVQTQLLDLSKRACAFCFGLHADHTLKRGQIAHVDQINSNATLDNLAWLCIDHHDEYDSKHRQSKGLTKGELLRYRSQLYEYNRRKFEQLTLKPFELARDVVSGDFERYGENDESIVQLTYLGKDSVCIQGSALWGTKNKYGPNMGSIELVGKLTGDRIRFENQKGSVMLTVVLEGEEILIEDEEQSGQFGAGVTFEGRYRKSTFY